MFANPAMFAPADVLAPLNARLSALAESALAKPLALGAAIAAHGGVAMALIVLMQAPQGLAPSDPPALDVQWITPVTLPTEPERVTAETIEPETIEPVASEPVPVDPIPDVTEPVRYTPAPTDSEPVDPVPVPEALPDSPSIAMEAHLSVLSAEGGQAGFALDAPQAATGSVLRGLLCAGQSENTRAAAGCDRQSQYANSAFAAYANPEGVAQINQAFSVPEPGLGYAPPTVDMGPMSLPGLVNSNQPHYLGGVHSSFGRLSLPAKAKDPGFGD